VDLRSRRPRPGTEELRRTVRLRLTESLDGDGHAAVIEAVVEETVRRAELDN
jgi:hypothetical protein